MKIKHIAIIVTATAVLASCATRRGWFPPPPPWSHSHLDYPILNVINASGYPKVYSFPRDLQSGDGVVYGRNSKISVYEDGTITIQGDASHSRKRAQRGVIKLTLGFWDYYNTDEPADHLESHLLGHSANFILHVPEDGQSHPFSEISEKHLSLNGPGSLSELFQRLHVVTVAIDVE